MLHFFFHGKEGISDEEILSFVEKSLDRENPRTWYWALMDYGAELKKITVNPNRKSAHYTRQSRFKGSLREIRGAIVNKLSGVGSQNGKILYSGIEKEVEDLTKENFYKAIEGLKKDMLVAEEKGVYKIC
jgi:A/G-specific adenine glycosylase